MERILSNLRRTRTLKTFTTLKKIPERLYRKHRWMLRLWKIVRVPCTWHIDTEVYIYKVSQVTWVKPSEEFTQQPSWDAI